MEKNREEAKRKLLEVTAFLKSSAMGLNDCIKGGIGTDLAKLEVSMPASLAASLTTAACAFISSRSFGPR